MPAICLNELSNYNNGTLVYKWFDLEDFTNAEEYNEAVCNWLETCPTVSGYPCEEWNIADYEDVPSEFVGDYSFDAESFYAYKDLTDQLEDSALAAYIDCFGSLPKDIEEFNDRFFMQTEEKNDNCHGFYIEIAGYLIDEAGVLNEVPEIIASYFDYEKYGRDVYMNDMTSSNGFVFWNH